MAQQLITNEVDCSLDLRPLTMETVLARTRTIITHTGSEPPYGYVDWWPTSLYVNNEREPFNDPDVRWALSYFIDRDQIIDVALGRRRQHLAAADAVLPGPAALHRRRRRPAGGVPDPGVQPGEGRRHCSRERAGSRKRRHVGEGRHELDVADRAASRSWPTSAR